MKRSRKLTPMLDRDYTAEDGYFAELGQRIQSRNVAAISDWLN